MFTSIRRASRNLSTKLMGRRLGHNRENPATSVIRKLRTEQLESRELLSIAPNVAPLPADGGGIWLSAEEVMQLPMSGPAWDTIEAAARSDISHPNISDQGDNTDTLTLAKALVGLRTGNQQYISEVRSTIMDAMGTEDGGRTLALGRNLVSYVIAADLVGLEPSQDARFRDWLRETRTEVLTGRTLISTQEDRPNNWGNHAGASRAATAIYLGDTADLQRTAQIFKGYLGDRDSYADFDYGSMTWQADSSKPVGINPKGAMKDGHSIDGVMPDDMRRGGSFKFPPTETGYPWEGMQGAIVEAQILYRAGYDAWQWEDQALLRSAEFLYGLGWEATGDDQWQPFLIDAAYGTDFGGNPDAGPGKNMGWTAWTHQLDTVPPQQNRAPVVDAGANQTILVSTILVSAVLDGTVTDDGLPSGTLDSLWTKTSGPGTVSFADAASEDTTATFSMPGTYLLTLTADDGQLSAYDAVTIVVVRDDYVGTTSFSFQNGLDGYNGTQDTRIRVDMPTRKFGSSSKLEIDGNPNFSSLLRWDLSSIPSGAAVQSATITLNAVNASDDVFELYELKRPWVESETTYNQAADGSPWQVAGVTGSQDRGSIVLGTLTAPRTGAAKVELNAAGIAVLQSWIANPASNHGFIFQDYTNATTDDLDFSSSEASTVANRPRLDISIGGDTTPDNQAPMADAGENQTTLVSVAIVLDGTVTDDGLPTGTLDTLWTKISGPGNVTFADAASEDTTATFSMPGTYVLGLTADDGELTAADQLTIVVEPDNQAPMADAGENQTTLVSVAIVLDGTVTDDGLPTGTLDTLWAKISGPGNVTFADAASGDTTATFSMPGTYVLGLTADDGELTAADQLTIVVEPDNQAPMADAGGNQTTLVSVAIVLDGTVTDDGLPLPGVVTTAWSVLSAPEGGVVTFGDASSIDTTASFSKAGQYVLSLTGDDGDLAAADQITVTVEDTVALVTRSFQDGLDGYHGTQDTRIRVDMPTRKFGSSSKLEIDGNPDFSSLIKWDLSSIPFGATLLSAVITVNAVNASDDTFELYELQRPWVESEATFNRASDANAWQVAGASGSQDRGSTVLGALTAPRTGLATAELNDAGIAVIQSWIANPQSNHGLILQDYVNASTDDLDFSSREASSVGNRPKLTLVYSASALDNRPPVLAQIGDKSVESDSLLSFTVSADDVDLDPLSYSADGLPQGATFDANTQVFGWTPSQDQYGPYDVTFRVSDGIFTDFETITITVQEIPVENQVPTVDAGLDRSILVSTVLTLDATVDDDGLPNPPATVATTWSKLSGPGTVSFNDASAVDTTAGFSQPGTYVLRITADDGELAASDELTVNVSDTTTPSQGIWISVEEVMALPMSGPAWDAIEAAARSNIGNPNISDQGDNTDTLTLAKALVGVRTGNQQYLSEVRSTIMAAMGTEDGGRVLALGRNLVSYVISADLVGLEPSQDARFREWLLETRSEVLTGRTLISTHEDRPNNWGNHAGASRAAVDLYLGDMEDLQRAAQVFKGYLGDRDSYADFKYGSLSWQADPSKPVGINPKGAMKDGHSIDGVMPDDMRRGGSFKFPPSVTGYPWEGLQGAVVQAQILYRAGYDAWQWEDRAVLRATEFLNGLGWEAGGDDQWQPFLINAAYGTNYDGNPDAGPGKNMGWTAWTHQFGNASKEGPQATLSTSYLDTSVTTADGQPTADSDAKAETEALWKMAMLDEPTFDAVDAAIETYEGLEVTLPDGMGEALQQPSDSAWDGDEDDLFWLHLDDELLYDLAAE